MNYKEYKEIERKTNEIGFALAKMVNNYCDVLNTAGVEKYITKGELLDLLYFDPSKNMIKLKPNYRALIFDAVSLAEVCNATGQRQQEQAQSVRELIRKTSK